MDVTLPGIDGFETTRRIRRLARPGGAIPIVGVSGRANNTDAAAGRAAGMAAYLAKPLSPSALAQVLDQVTSRPRGRLRGQPTLYLSPWGRGGRAGEARTSGEGPVYGFSSGRITLTPTLFPLGRGSAPSSLHCW